MASKQTSIKTAIVFCALLSFGVNAKQADQAIQESEIVSATPFKYIDNRPSPKYRLDAKDQGVILKYGDGPNKSDVLGARDVAVYKHGVTYYMYYDGSGPTAWLANLATSTDLKTWKKHGAVLDLGNPGAKDSASASFGNIIYDGSKWHMLYLSTVNASTSPNFVPVPSYHTSIATAPDPKGPWTKNYDLAPFPLAETSGTFYNLSSAPGHVFKDGDGYTMMVSAANETNMRTIAVAHTKSLDSSWKIKSEPIVPVTEQIENGSIYYQKSDKTWFMFVNHVGIDSEIGEYTDAVWVYWTKDFESWNPEHKAVVLDSSNVKWAPKIIGLPSVIQVGDRLAIFYDGQEVKPKAGADWPEYHMKRDIGLAWLNLPIKTP